MQIAGNSLKGQVRKLKDLARRYQLDALKDVILFILITLIIHYSYRFWANQLHFAPIRDWMVAMREWMSLQVYEQSLWIVRHLTGIEFTAVDQNTTFYFANNGYIAVNQSCSGFKQILQFALLMMVYPGLWKRKLWYIPAGILIVHLTNLFRISGLSVVIVHFPKYWDFSHDYLFRPFFYVVIFAMWVFWVEKIGRPQKEKEADT